MIILKNISSVIFMLIIYVDACVCVYVCIPERAVLHSMPHHSFLLNKICLHQCNLTRYVLAFAEYQKRDQTLDHLI